MSKITVNKSGVSDSIRKINSEYPKVFDSLKDANTKFDELKEFWYGERYFKIVKAWNETVNSLNQQLTTLSEISRTMSVMLKNITTADTDTVVVKAVEPKKLTGLIPNTNKNITIDTEKLTNSNKVIVAKLNTARQSIDTIIKTARNAEWKTPATDTFNQTVTKIGNNLLTSIDTIRKAVDENLTTTVEEFIAADNANKGTTA